MTPFVAKHESGTRSLALLTSIGAKRVASDPIVELEVIKKPRTKSLAEPHDLEIILASSQYGDLVNMDSYKPLESPFFLQGYKECKTTIARKLAGSIIQTGVRAFLVVKVEVYGRSPSDDPHSFDL
ncbi:hypothetical protein BGZ46_005514, partial [Entomortierella lignicola]